MPSDSSICPRDRLSRVQDIARNVITQYGEKKGVLCRRRNVVCLRQVFMTHQFWFKRTRWKEKLIDCVPTGSDFSFRSESTYIYKEIFFVLMIHFLNLGEITEGNLINYMLNFRRSVINKCCRSSNPAPLASRRCNTKSVAIVIFVDISIYLNLIFIL